MRTAGSAALLWLAGCGEVRVRDGDAAPFSLRGAREALWTTAYGREEGTAVIVVTEEWLGCDALVDARWPAGRTAFGSGRGLALRLSEQGRTPQLGLYAPDADAGHVDRDLEAWWWDGDTVEPIEGEQWLRLDSWEWRIEGVFANDAWSGAFAAGVCEGGDPTYQWQGDSPAAVTAR